MAAVVLDKVSRRYGDTVAVQSLDLEIADKEFVVLLGPSGCGKTTTLNMIAGMDAPTSGHILFDGQRVEHVPPERRNVAMVFQSIALYPHKSVYENIAFPLRMAKVPRSEIDRRVRAAADLMRIAELLNRRPHELSGGQRQRVALGRAAIRDPSVFLFDEPLSALDAKLRSDMRLEIKKLHERLSSTFIYVTHDQAEALTMADRIAVIDHGRLQQYAEPSVVYQLPANTAVASFVGNPGMNLISGRLSEVDGEWRILGQGISIPLRGAPLAAVRSTDGPLTLGVRPENLHLKASSEAMAFHGQGRVYAVEPLGSDQFVDAIYGMPENAGGQLLVKLRTSPDLCVRVGDAISLSAHPERICLFNGSGVRVFPDAGTI
jgi:multiple sugar transport system ATP-binding protein